MYNYESDVLKEYARELRARVRSVLPEGAAILCDKRDALYFVRLPKRNCSGGKRTFEGDLRRETLDETAIGKTLRFFSEESAKVESRRELPIGSIDGKSLQESPGELELEESLKQKLAKIGFDCAFSSGALLISPRAELMIEFERRFAPRGFLSRSLERFRGVNSAGEQIQGGTAPEEDRCANFGSDSVETIDHVDSKFVSTGGVRCTNRSNGFVEASSSADSSVSTEKICCGTPQNSFAKTVGYADLSGKSTSSAGILLFSEGLKRIEQPEPSKVKTYSRRAREFAAVCLRTGCGMGCYACARIAEEIERWV